MEIKENNVLNGKLLEIDWVSDVNGDASQEITGYGGYFLQAFQTIPGENGDRSTDLPTSYNLQLNDAYDLDFASGKGAARSGTIAEIFYNNANEIMLPPLFNVVIDTAGNTKKGRILLFLKDKV